MAQGALGGAVPPPSRPSGASGGELLRGRVGFALTPVGLPEALRILGDGEVALILDVSAVQGLHGPRGAGRLATVRGVQDSARECTA